jgi:hypothetical protein
VLDFTVGPSPDLTIRHLLLEAGVIKKGKGPGVVKAPWSTTPFKRREWAEQMQDPGFRLGATGALQEVSTAGGVQKYLLAKTSVDDDDGEEES